MRLGIGVSTLCLIVVFVLLTPIRAAGQDGDPPPCCNSKSALPTQGDRTPGNTPLIVMPDNALSAVGITRSQFVDFSEANCSGV
jgi:hypothetical protein